MDVLAFPFAFTASGEAAHVAQHSDLHAAQQISQFVQTRIGQLPLAPTYGLEDPVFRGIETTEITAGLAVFHPRVSIIKIDNEYKSEGVQSLTVQFEVNNTSLVTSVPAIDSQVTFNA